MDWKQQYPQLATCIDGAKKMAVRNAIEIGHALLAIKRVTPHDGSWSTFMKNNFGYSIRSCQNFMYVAKHPVAEKYYPLGLEGVMERLRAGDDLSR